MACDLALRFMGGCLPDFTGWSGHPSIAAISISLGNGAMGQKRSCLLDRSFSVRETWIGVTETGSLANDIPPCS